MKKPLKKGPELAYFRMRKGHGSWHDLQIKITEIEIENSVATISTDITENLKVKNQDSHCVQDVKDFIDDAAGFDYMQIDSEQIIKGLITANQNHDIEKWRLRVIADGSAFEYPISVSMNEHTATLTNLE